jgi:hypothetical protein
MHTTPLRCTLSRTAFQVTVVTAIVALLLSAIGPLADHHFAERHPGHAHVYLGPEAPDHAHPYQAGHFHSQAHGDDQPGSGGIVFLTAQDGLGQGYVDLAAPVVLQSAVIPGPDDNLLLFGAASGDMALHGTVVGPLKHPPRA